MTQQNMDELNAAIKASSDSFKIKLPMTERHFKIEGEKVHCGQYIYTDTKFVSENSPVDIFCPICQASFSMMPRVHLNGKGCPKHALNGTDTENDLEAHLKLYGLKYIKNDRTILEGKEIDFYLPEKKIGFEINGLNFHSNLAGKDENYHIGKTMAAHKKGIELIHISEDIIKNRPEAFFNFIEDKLNLNDRRSEFQTKLLKLDEISDGAANEFLNTYCINDDTEAYNVQFGIYAGQLLVAVIVGAAKDKKHLMVRRLATRTGIRVPTLHKWVEGRLSKMFNHVTMEIDLRYHTNKFSKIVRQTPPKKLYIKGDKIVKEETGKYIYNCGIA